MGFGEATITKRSGDGGIDGYLTKDELGFEKNGGGTDPYYRVHPVFILSCT